MSTSERLRQLRKDLGMSQEEFGLPYRCFQHSNF